MARNACGAIVKFLPKAVFADGERLRIPSRIEELDYILDRLQKRMADQIPHPPSDTPD
jgi:hypothetical protein